MIIPDANVLIYAYDQRSPYHAMAKRWWTEVLEGSQPVGIPWVVLLAFTRLLTHPHLCQQPLSVAEVRILVAQWFEQPQVNLLHLPTGAVDGFFDGLEEAGGGGNLTTDAMIALHALAHGGTVYTNDRDFGRFAQLRVVNPLRP